MEKFSFGNANVSTNELSKKASTANGWFLRNDSMLSLPGRLYPEVKFVVKYQKYKQKCEQYVDPSPQ